MEQRTQQDLSPYRVFSRAEWAMHREDTPMTLKPVEVARLRWGSGLEVGDYLAASRGERPFEVGAQTRRPA